MASRTTSRDQTAARPNDPDSSAAVAANAAVQQLAGAATAASALLRAADSIAQTQQHMLQRAALLQEQTAERLRHATSPMEVMSIQSSLLVSSWGEMAQYAQEWMLAALKVQGELVRPGDAEPAPPNPVTTAAVPLFQAWQAAFTAPMNGSMGDMRH